MEDIEKKIDLYITNDKLDEGVLSSIANITKVGFKKYLLPAIDQALEEIAFQIEKLDPDVDTRKKEIEKLLKKAESHKSMFIETVTKIEKLMKS